MAKIREYLGKTVRGIVYTLLATPFMLTLWSPLYEGHKSGFFKSYNQAITRNADMDGDGRVTAKEEFETRKVLHEDIAKLSQKGANLEDIVDFLRNK